MLVSDCGANHISEASLLRLTRREWAWEFLRRNPAFQRDWENAADYLAEPKNSLPRGMAGTLEKWGILFRRFAKAAGAGSQNILVAGNLTTCSEALPHGRGLLSRRDAGEAGRHLGSPTCCCRRSRCDARSYPPRWSIVADIYFRKLVQRQDAVVDWSLGSTQLDAITSVGRLPCHNERSPVAVGHISARQSGQKAFDCLQGP